MLGMEVCWEKRETLVSGCGVEEVDGREGWQRDRKGESASE